MALELTQEQKDAGWLSGTLEEFLTLIIDHRGKTPKKLGGDWSESGHRVISAINMKNSRVDGNDHHYVDDEIFAKWMKIPVAVGDVFLTSEAPMGAVAYISDHEATDWVVGQRIFALRADEKQLHGRYLYYLLQTNNMKEQLESRSSGTTVMGIKQAELRKVELILQPVEEQKRIAEILGSLDDKIEANSRLLDSLSELAIAEVERLELFSEEPNSVLGDLITFSPKVPKPDSDTYQFIDMSVLPTTGPITGAISHKENWTGSKFEEGDTLFSRITPCLENGKTAIAMGLGDKPGIGSTEFIVMRALEAGKELLPYGIARNERFREIAIQKMTGTSGRQRVKWQDLASTPVNATRVSGFQLGKAEFELMRSFREENILLASIRNLLIRHLIG